MSAAPDEVFDAELEARRLAERAMRLLSRPGAVVEARALGYGVRLGASRRRCVMLTPGRGGVPGVGPRGHAKAARPGRLDDDGAAGARRVAATRTAGA